MTSSAPAELLAGGHRPADSSQQPSLRVVEQGGDDPGVEQEVDLFLSGLDRLPGALEVAAGEPGAGEQDERVRMPDGRARSLLKLGAALDLGLRVDQRAAGAESDAESKMRDSGSADPAEPQFLEGRDGPTRKRTRPGECLRGRAR